MKTPPRISFRHMEPSPAVQADIQSWVAKLEEYSDRITTCRVMIEAPHHHQRRGRLFRVRVQVGVPNRSILGGRSVDEQRAHEDVYVAVRDAFREARRQLEEHVRRTRGQVRSRTEAGQRRRETA